MNNYDKDHKVHVGVLFLSKCKNGFHSMCKLPDGQCCVICNICV